MKFDPFKLNSLATFCRRRIFLTPPLVQPFIGKYHWQTISGALDLQRARFPLKLPKPGNILHTTEYLLNPRTHSDPEHMIFRRKKTISVSSSYHDTHDMYYHDEMWDSYSDLFDPNTGEPLAKLPKL